MVRKIGWTEDDRKNVLAFVGLLIDLVEQPWQPDLYAIWERDNLRVSGDRLTTKRGQKRVEENLGTTKGALLNLLKQANQRLLLPSQRPDNDANQIAEILDVLECLEQIGLLTEDGKLKNQGYRRFSLALLARNKRQANLDYVAERWREVATQKLSKTILRTDCPSEINWSAICREQNAKLRRSPTEEGFEPEIFVPLGLMERKQQQRRPINQEMGMDQVYGVEEKAEVTRKFEHQEFLSYIGLGGKQAENAKNVAIIGEPGAGKTTLLANLAQVIDENKGLAIAISLGSFGAWQSLEPKRNLKDYLEQKWLEDALPDQNVSETDRVALADRFRQGGVWLLLDGLDEMQASSPVEALAQIEKEVRSGYLQKARVVLTCRVNIWDANLTNPLREFETYKTLDFAESQRDDFIRQWFTKKGNLALGEGLINQLKESGRERICELVKNPLRLVLLCYIWTQQVGELPETKAQFYQRYLRYFYEWKKEVRDLTGKRQQQAQLHQALGQLAIAGIESSSRYRLSESLAVQEMGEDCFQLAVDLGWLNIVDREQGTDEAVYAFFHPTFQEFFAACGVEDWDFFLPRDHGDRPVEGKVYRIFEAKWKEVILLWLGRGDVKNEEKEAFIKALVEFKDSLRYFYGYRAFYLAAAGISEFKYCSLADQIVNQIIRWSFGYFELETGKRMTFLKPIQESARKILLETDRSRAITGLINLLSSPDIHEYTRLQAAESLGRIDPGNQEAIATLIHLISSPNTEEYICTEATECLGLIGKGNQAAITALIKLLSSPDTCGVIRSKVVRILRGLGHGNKDAISALINLLSSPEFGPGIAAAWILERIGHGNKDVIATLINLLSSPDEYDINTRWKAAKVLGKINPDNPEVIAALPEVIAALIKLISSPDKSVSRQAAWSLGGIGQGNQEAIAASINLLSSPNESICFQAARCLGGIGKGNQEAIAALINLLSSSDKYIHRQVVESLGQIGQGNQEAITALINLLSSPNEYTRLEAADSLGKIGHGNQEVIATLIKLLSSPDKSIRWQAARRLGEFEQGNKEVIAALIKLLSSPNTDEHIREQVAESLGKIGQGNQEAITALINLLSSPNEYTRWEAADSLGKIGHGNKEANSALIDILQSSTDSSEYILNESIGKQAVKSLEKILQKEQMPDVVTALKDYPTNETYNNNFDQFEGCYKVLWKCAQTLSYHEFYQAWHHPPITPHPEILDTTPIDSTALTQTLNLQLLPNELPNHCLYLDAQPLNPYSLPELSQELCNLIHQHLNQYPIPEANNLPQLKRHLLPLLAQHPQLTLIFGNAYPSDTLLTFCQQLNATIAIAWINDQAIPNLQTFSPQDPNLLEKISNWLNR